MPVKIAIDVDRGIAVRTVVGDPTAKEVVEAMGRSYTDPAFKRGMNSLWDLRRCNLGIVTTWDVREIVWFAEGTVATRGSGHRTALVAPNRVDHGTLRVLQILGSHLPGDIRIFMDYEEALAWVSEGPPAQSDAADAARPGEGYAGEAEQE